MRTAPAPTLAGIRAAVGMIATTTITAATVITAITATESLKPG